MENISKLLKLRSKFKKIKQREKTSHKLGEDIYNTHDRQNADIQNMEMGKRHKQKFHTQKRNSNVT